MCNYCNCLDDYDEGVKLPFVGDTPPKYAYETDAGFDFHSDGKYLILPGETIVIPTGLQLAVPIGYELQIRSRRGLASRGVIVANSPGTIDSGYRGEIKIILHHLMTRYDTTRPFVINAGDRIAQGVLAKFTQAKFYKVKSLSKTERGSGGLGSTGLG
jgi:dUTP pyrophosphatase